MLSFDLILYFISKNINCLVRELFAAQECGISTFQEYQIYETTKGTERKKFPLPTTVHTPTLLTCKYMSANSSS